MIVLHYLSGKFLARNITTSVYSFKFIAPHPSLVFLAEAFFLVSLLEVPLVAGFERTAQPVSLTGTAESAIFAPESESVLLNPSAAASQNSFHLALFYSPSPFDLPQLANYGMTAVCPWSPVDLAVSTASAGFSLYRELTTTVTIAKSFDGIFLAGVNVNIDHLAIARYGSSSTIGIDVAASMQVTDDVRWGFSLLNVNRPAIGGADGQLPEVYITGVTCRPTPFADISFSVIKDVLFPASVRTGVDFSPVGILRLRIGISTEPSRYFAGFGVQVSPVTIDYAVATHEELGLTHSVGVSIAF
jgi:hypothetical protein